ncbi:hypothetical protein [Amycolatopsis sp. CA-230715]|uniref:hypothetical protein n=1 Tax=Amycolatopsis sp. CA-230715 TaxID=2745196 RepID=UPI001C00FA5E|nr:hypothetical protein [Amycolatopsis sp. CA-230715]QWF82603.1 hypothetical protein HUW46_06041 [Amycolatopsis sp. CA-230715]
MATLSLGFLAALTLATVPPSTASASADPRGTYVDYSWIGAPTDLHGMRMLRPALKVPTLLYQACAEQSDGSFGEDYQSTLLAKTELLRMLDTPEGTRAIRDAVAPTTQTYAMHTPANMRACLANLDPTWAEPYSGPKPRESSWAQVKAGLLAVPPLHGTPGTDNVPTCRAEHEGDWDMAMAMMTRVYLLAGDHLRGDPAMDREMARRSWLQGAPVREDSVVCRFDIVVTHYDIPETENHNLLIQSTRLLHNESLPMLSQDEVANSGNKAVGTYDKSFDPDNIRNGLRHEFDLKFSSWLRNDFLEYNARPYSRLQMIGLLNLYDFTKDESLRGTVRAVLDLLSAKSVTESQGELRNEPFRRKVEHWGDPLFNGDPIAPMMQVWVGDLAPFRTPAANFALEGALAGSTTYRPPDVLADLLLQPKHDAYQQTYNGRGQNERVYGQPGFLLGGGGTATDCPYPNPAPVGGHCIGSGNDSGTVLPITLIPRRDAAKPPADPRAVVSEAPMPGVDSVYHSTNPGLVLSADSCIGTGFACAAGFDEGSPRWVKNDGQCRVERSDPNGDTVKALRYDRSCVADEHFPADSCFLTYQREIKNAALPLSVLVTHNCAAGSPGLFTEFVNYMDTTGKPTGVTTGQGARRTVAAKMTMPSAADGPPSAGNVVTLNGSADSSGREDVRYWADGDQNWPNAADGVSAQGTVANLSFDPARPNLRLENPRAGEIVVDPLWFGGQPVPTSTDRGFAAGGKVVSQNGTDTLRLSVTGIDQPELIVSGIVTVTSPGRPPFTTGLTNYRANPLTSGAQDLTLTAPSPDPGHTYTAEICYDWIKFFTAADYRADISGPLDNIWHTCRKVTVGT